MMDVVQKTDTSNCECIRVKFSWSISALYDNHLSSDHEVFVRTCENDSTGRRELQNLFS
jgi:hypothetical protein